MTALATLGHLLCLLGKWLLLNTKRPTNLATLSIGTRPLPVNADAKRPLYGSRKVTFSGQDLVVEPLFPAGNFLIMKGDEPKFGLASGRLKGRACLPECH